MRVTLAGLAFAAAVRVIHGIHHDTANRGAHAEPAHRAGLAEYPQVVLIVADLADGGAAVDMNLAHFAGLQPQAGVHAFARRELRRAAGAARQLAALANLQLDVVRRPAHGDVPQGQRIALLDRSIAAGTNLIARLHALGREDVAALAVLVQHQGQVRG